MELSLYAAIAIMAIAFLCEYMDSTLGMGYGTTMTPILLLFGFKPLEIVPSVLLSELVTGFLAGFFHHKEGNVFFSVKSFNPLRAVKKIRQSGLKESLRQGVSSHLRIVIILVSGSVLGAGLGAFTGKALPRFWVQFYIGVLVIAMGAVIFIYLDRQFKFSWAKLGLLGLIASFNKGLTGGGYGPLVASGQLLSGVSATNAVGITSLAEGITSLMGVAVYLSFEKGTVCWALAPFIILGAALSTPLSAKSVKLIGTKKLKIAMGVLTLILGFVTLIKLFAK
jgi:uncharacterized protein